MNCASIKQEMQDRETLSDKEREEVTGERKTDRQQAKQDVEPAAELDILWKIFKKICQEQAEINIKYNNGTVSRHSYDTQQEIPKTVYIL